MRKYFILPCMITMLLMCLITTYSFADVTDLRKEIRASDYFDEIPDVLRFSQIEGNKNNVNKHLYTRNILPQTVRPEIDLFLQDRIYTMEEKGKEQMLVLLPKNTDGGLETGSYIFRSGKSMMSFLVQCSGITSKDQVYSEIETYTFDMTDGKRISLTDLFDDESEVWDYLGNQIVEQLGRYFENEEPVTEALKTLCQKAVIQQTPMNLTAGRLILHYKADQLYPGHSSYLHVEVYYPEIQKYMNAYGLEQTNNRRYRLAALTYDDGPPAGNTGSTVSLLRTMQKYGIASTFFMVGKNIKANPGVVHRAFDGGMEIASHSFEHETSINKNQAQTYTEKMDVLLDNILGIKPDLFRAPGGNFGHYINTHANKIMVKWSVIAGDADPDANQEDIIAIMRFRPEAGDIILCHDMTRINVTELEESAPHWEENNMMMVTVSELMSIYGMVPERDVVYEDCIDAVMNLINP